MEVLPTQNLEVGARLVNGGRGVVVMFSTVDDNSTMEY